MMRFVYAMIGAVVLMALVVLYSHQLSEMHYEISHPKLSTDKPYTIALITDLHACYYGEGQRELLDILYREQPDVIALGGDIYDDKMPFAHADTLVSRLSLIAPTYYVDGNHENWLPKGEYQSLMKRIQSYGVTVLHGRSVDIHEQIVLHGVSDPDGGHFDEDLVSVRQQVDDDKLNILLTHRPERIDDYHDFDVAMAGHAHGGQWRIPFLVNGVFAPNQGFFPKYAGGRYDVYDDKNNNTTLIVSRGLARESTRIPRIFNRPR